MTTRNALDAARDTANESACRLIGFVALWPDTPPAQAALRDLDPSAVALLDDAPRAILGAMRGLVDAGKVPDVDAATLAVGFDCWCDLGCAVAVSESMMNPAVVPGSAVEVVNQLAVLNRTFEGARAIGQATRSGNTHAATEAARKMVESLSTKADDALFVDSAQWQSMAEEQPPWLINGWLLRGCTTVLSSPGGVGKSMLSLGLALQIASGKGMFPGLPSIGTGRVMVLSGEDSAPVAFRRMKAFCVHHRIPDADEAIKKRIRINTAVRPIFTQAPDGSLCETEYARAIAAAVREWKPDLIVCDHLRRLTGAVNQNDSATMGEAIGWFNRVAAESGAAVLLLAHHSKQESREGTASAIRGSSVIGDEARACWNLSRKKGADSPLRLEQTKTNYGTTGATVFFRFVNVPDAGCVCLVQDDAAATNPTTGTGLAAMMGTAIKWLEGAERIAKGSTQNGLGAAADLLDTLKHEHGTRVDARHMAEVFALMEDRGIVTVRSEDDGRGRRKPFYRLAENAQTGEDYADDDVPF